MQKEFALERGGPKRLRVTYSRNLSDAKVSLDGQIIISIPTKADFLRGTTCKLPDGSMLSVRFGPIEGAPFLKGVHVIRNGAPLPGSAADPIPGWAWIFIVACGLIPVVSLGGAIPALIGVAGVSGTLSLARVRHFSAVARAAGCTVITFTCWCSFGLLIAALTPKTSAKGWDLPLSKTIFMSSSPEKLVDQIDAEVLKRGYNEKALSQINDTLRQSCEHLEKKQCVAYLRTALIEEQTRHMD